MHSNPDTRRYVVQQQVASDQGAAWFDMRLYDYTEEGKESALKFRKALNDISFFTRYRVVYKTDWQNANSILDVIS